jgi:putative membrane protein
MVIIVVGILVILLIAGGIGFGMMGGGGMMGWWGYGGYWWMPLMMLGFVILIGFGIYYMVVAFTPRRESSTRTEGERALSIARERLARGEITPEEYERLRKLLSE